MRGRYLIYTPLESRPKGWYRDDHRFRTNWHKFVSICRSLNRDRLTYHVQLNLTGDNPHVLITAHGTAVWHPKPVVRPTAVRPLASEHIRQQIRAIEYHLPEHAEACKQAYVIAPRVSGQHRDELGSMTVEQLRAELDHWRELELLSGEREHCRASRKNEIPQADDEVAA